MMLPANKQTTISERRTLIDPVTPECSGDFNSCDPNSGLQTIGEIVVCCAVNPNSFQSQFGFSGGGGGYDYAVEGDPDNFPYGNVITRPYGCRKDLNVAAGALGAALIQPLIQAGFGNLAADVEAAVAAGTVFEGLTLGAIAAAIGPVGWLFIGIAAFTTLFVLLDARRECGLG